MSHKKKVINDKVFWNGCTSIHLPRSAKRMIGSAAPVVIPSSHWLRLKAVAGIDEMVGGMTGPIMVQVAVEVS